MRSPRRLHLGLALTAAALSASCGCGHRVEEPVPEVRRPAATGTPPASAAQGRTAEEAKAKRCVRESPKTPRRATPPRPDPRCPKDPDKVPALRTAKVTFPAAGKDGAETTITVEVAEKEHERERGLMYRTRMGDDHGMIFLFQERSDHAFWMHNTCIPLDMLYIDEDGFIVGIEENTPTLSDDTFAVGCDSRYVLEVNAGWTRAHGVLAGQKAKIEGI